jgi:hypothetical protein
MLNHIVLGGNRIFFMREKFPRLGPQPETKQPPLTQGKNAGKAASDLGTQSAICFTFLLDVLNHENPKRLDSPDSLAAGGVSGHPHLVKNRNHLVFNGLQTEKPRSRTAKGGKY